MRALRMLAAANDQAVVEMETEPEDVMSEIDRWHRAALSRGVESRKIVSSKRLVGAGVSAGIPEGIRWSTTRARR